MAKETEQQLEFLFPDTSLTFADFFSGAGGFSLGLINAGLKCVSAMELADDVAWTYWYNLCYKGWSHLWIEKDNKKVIEKIQKKWNGGETSNLLFPKGVPDNWLSTEIEEPMPCLNFFLYDINNLEPEQWMEMIGVRKGDIKIFVGGPPCQGFSIAGQRNVGDERNQLPLRMIYYAKVCQPDYVLIENVPGLLSLGRGKEKESPFVKWIRNAFDEAGYNMTYEVHNAADYGVPQKRKRVLFFAARKGLDSNLKVEKTHGDLKEYYVTVKEAIGDLPPINAGETYDGHAYGYNSVPGYVICSKCLNFVKEERNICQNCKNKMDNPIKGGVYRIPGMGILIDTKNKIE